MFIGSEEDYGDGDLAVNWRAKNGTQNTGGGDMGPLLMRGNNDEMGQLMGKFYWDHEFDNDLHQILINAGFSREASEEVAGSEWGMQDEGRASYDAGEIANEVRQAAEQFAPYKGGEI